MSENNIFNDNQNDNQNDNENDLNDDETIKYIKEGKPEEIKKDIAKNETSERFTITDENDKPLKKMTKKQKLVNDILNLASKTGHDVGSKRDLSRTRLSQLERIMANMINKTVDPNFKTVEEKKIEKSQLSDDLAVKSLFNVNLIFFRFTEGLTTTYSDHIPFSLEGLTKTTLEKEEEIKETLKLVMDEHGSEIKQYLSPTTQYFMLMFAIVAQTAIKNSTEKKNNSEDISIKSPPISHSVPPLLESSQQS